MGNKEPENMVKYLESRSNQLLPTQILVITTNKAVLKDIRTEIKRLKNQ